MEIIKRSNIFEIIEEIKGELFSVIFTKKDGSEREMLCRRGVKKHTNGVGLKFDAISKGLLPVYDMGLARKVGEDELKKCYRMVNVNTLSQIKFRNKVYKVEG